MTTVQACELPPVSLLHDLQKRGAWADCYAADVDGAVSQAAFVEAFYTTPLFKLERLLIRWFAGKPTTDADVARLAQGSADAFAAWRVERRSADQLLLADLSGRTRSWLMTVPIGGVAGGPRTRLYFGSAVLPRRGRDGAAAGMGPGFNALLGFHKLYSRALLGAARARLVAGVR
jgi:hypothetical protein